MAHSCHLERLQVSVPLSDSRPLFLCQADQSGAIQLFWSHHTSPCGRPCRKIQYLDHHDRPVEHPDSRATLSVSGHGLHDSSILGGVGYHVWSLHISGSSHHHSDFATRADRPKDWLYVRRHGRDRADMAWNSGNDQHKELECGSGTVFRHVTASGVLSVAMLSVLADGPAIYHSDLGLLAEAGRFHSWDGMQSWLAIHAANLLVTIPEPPNTAARTMCGIAASRSNLLRSVMQDSQFPNGSLLFLHLPDDLPKRCDIVCEPAQEQAIDTALERLPDAWPGAPTI